MERDFVEMSSALCATGAEFLIRVIEPIHRRSVLASHEVPIDVDGHLDAAVPELRLHVHEALAVLQQ